MLFRTGHSRFAMSVAILFLSGCATNAPPAPGVKRQAPAQTKIVTQTCTTTTKPENICAQPKPCSMIASCAEAYYRYTMCGDLSLDAGRNGVPCQDKCSREANALEMAGRITRQPFVVPTKQETACNPA
jgi:hypothetical protein